MEKKSDKKVKKIKLPENANWSSVKSSPPFPFIGSGSSQSYQAW
jgi:hypothetical protein